MYIIIGYDINKPLMTMYEIMTLCNHNRWLCEKLQLEREKAALQTVCVKYVGLKL